MLLEDIDYLFKQQIDDGEQRLYFMLIDGDYKLIERHPVERRDELAATLDSFVFDGYSGKLPRFRK
jgi:hypothetical protein